MGVALPVPHNSEFVRTVRFLQGSGGLPVHLADSLRPLRGDEIRRLEHQGNRCADWSRIRVAAGFVADRVHGSHLIGDCVLGAFHDSGGIPTGVYDSTLRDAVVGDDSRVYRCPLLEAVVCDHHATLIAARIAVSRNDAHDEPGGFANGIELSVGLETGGRPIPIAVEMTSALVAALMAGDPVDQELHRDWAAYVAGVAAYATFRGTYVGKRAIVDGATLSEAWIGTGARITTGSAVENATILSSDEAPTTITGHARVACSIVHWGCSLADGALTHRSCLMERVSVGRGAIVQESIVAPNGALAEAEVTASYLGPFTAAHHHSLVIATSWPGGRGNVGYGANVGSNHTGRAPDQQLLAGEGQFFGLDCAVKFPADLARAPYTVIATGVMTAPQRMTLPFSLIAQLPPALTSHGAMGVNLLVPAWMVRDNLYALARGEQKYRSRNRATHEELEWRIFRPDLLPLLRDARDALAAADGAREVYSGRDIPAIGTNLVREPDRRRAIDAYAWVIRMIELREAAALGPLETPERDELCALLARFFSGARRSRDKDWSRGTGIISDYAASHVPLDSDPVLTTLAETLRAEVGALGGDERMIGAT